jgi:hypothetical protein
MTTTDQPALDRELMDLSVDLDRAARLWQLRGYMGLHDTLRLAAEQAAGWAASAREDGET